MSLSLLILKRFLTGVVLLFAVSLLVFFGTGLLPGDLAQAILGQTATSEALDNLRADLGLDRPMAERYLDWLGNFVQGDFGRSLSNGSDIRETVGQRLSNTLFLALYAAFISVPLAVLLGLLSVLYRDAWFDRLVSGTTLVFISLPEFFVGYLLILFFSIRLQLFPSVATVHDGMDFFEKLGLLFLPAVALTLVVLAHMARMTKAAILNILQSPYIEMAELKGLGRFNVIFRHALPNAVSPIANVVMVNMAYLVVGVVVVEVIFVYPGMGQYMVDHVAKRDLPVVQACGLIFALAYVFLNTLADVISIASNPRLRHPA